MRQKRLSKRKYPTKTCQQCSNSFVPTDRRQKYCCAQCRIDYNNDKRLTQEAGALYFKKVLIHNQRCLKKAYDVLARENEEHISIDFLKYDGFEPGVYSDISLNETLGTKILWSLDYGIEGVDRNKILVKIKKR